jgi:hypothetical protein
VAPEDFDDDPVDEPESEANNFETVHNLKHHHFVINYKFHQKVVSILPVPVHIYIILYYIYYYYTVIDCRKYTRVGRIRNREYSWLSRSLGTTHLECRWNCYSY